MCGCAVVLGLNDNTNQPYVEIAQSQQHFDANSQTEAIVQGHFPEAPVEPAYIDNIDRNPVPPVLNKGFPSVTHKSSPVCNGDKVTQHWHELNNVVVVTRALNIRKKYGSNQRVIGTARQCDQLTVIDKRVERLRKNKHYKTRGWLKVETKNGTVGWVASWHTRYVN